MRRRTDDREYPLYPRIGIAWRGLFWLFWGLILIGGAVGGSYAVVQQVNLPSYREYLGELRPDRDPVAINLPAGVYLDQILVERGAQVKSGQTIATLDIAAMTARLAEIDRQIIADFVLRSCLLGTTTVPDRQPVADPEFTALVQLARRECANQQEQRATRQAQHAVDRSILEERRKLFQSYLFLSMRHIRAEGDRLQPLHTAVSLAISKNILDQKIANLDHRTAQERFDFNNQTIAEARKISERIAVNLQLRAVLSRYVQSPRLLAPDSGHINRIRPVQPGTSLREPVEIVDITPAGQAAFWAEFKVPANDIDLISLGMEVQMTLLGGWHKTPVLVGHIEKIVQGQGGFVTVAVQVSEQSVTDLAAPTDGVALRETGTASALQVRFADYHLGAELLRGLSVLAPQNIGGLFNPVFAPDVPKPTHSRDHQNRPEQHLRDG